MGERNYLREKIELLRVEYTNNLRKQREQWILERNKFEAKINSLELYITKMSYSNNVDLSARWLKNNSIMNNSDIINDNNPNNFNSTQNYQAQIYKYYYFIVK